MAGQGVIPPEGAAPGFAGWVAVLPQPSLSVATRAAELGLGDDAVERLRQGGLERVPVDGPRPLAALVGEALEALAREVGGLEGRVGAVILAHSVPSLAPWGHDPLAGALDQVGLARVPRFALAGQPCAIMHFAIGRACALLDFLPPGEGIVVVGADKVWDDRERFFFGSAMGDGVVAGMLVRGASRHRVLATRFTSRIVAAEGEDSPAQEIAAFRAMSPFHVRDVVAACLQDARCRLEDVAWIAPHTPYQGLWDVLCPVLRFPRERVLSGYLGQTGHLNANDAVAHYLRAVADRIVKSGDLVLLVNPGFGGTWGATLVLC